jgi:hypothetical protein
MLATLLLLSASHADPTPLACCADQSSSKTLSRYLKVRRSLLEDGDAFWNAQISAWAPVVRRPQGPQSEVQRKVYEALYKQIWRLRSTNDRAAIIAEFSDISRKVAFLVLHAPGGKAVVGEARCGEQYWLQPLDAELEPLVDDGCTPEWITP